MESLACGRPDPLERYLPLIMWGGVYKNGGSNQPFGKEYF
jgi:hypothetical protein